MNRARGGISYATVPGVSSSSPSWQCSSRLRDAGAAGFLIQEQSARGIGTSFVGEPAIAEDASTAYFMVRGTHEGGANIMGAQVSMQLD